MYQHWHDTLRNAKSGENIVIDINSTGGDLQVLKNILKSIKASSATVTTISKGAEASSAASVLLFYSDNSFAYTPVTPNPPHTDIITTDMVLHTVRHSKYASVEQPPEGCWAAETEEKRNRKPLKGKYLGAMFMEDYPIGSKDWKSLRGSNQWLRAVYKKSSTEDLTQQCLEKIITGKQDTIVSPKAAIQLGFIKAALNPITDEVMTRYADYEDTIIATINAQLSMEYK